MEIKDIEKEVGEIRAELKKKIREVEGRRDEVKAAVKDKPVQWTLIAIGAGIVCGALGIAILWVL